jgi:hypothetical protein
MAQYLPSGDLKFPSQGSNEISEFVKHFESDVSFDALQIKINLYLLLLKSPAFTNRPAIRDIRFQVFESQPPQPIITYYAQLHFVLVGDGDDSASI